MGDGAPPTSSSSPSIQGEKKPNSEWDIWGDLPQYDPTLKTNSQGEFILYQLDMKANKSNKSKTENLFSKLESVLHEKIGNAIDGLVPVNAFSSSLHLTDQNLRDYLHGKKLRIEGTIFVMQAYPPPEKEAPHFKLRPKGQNTLMRLHDIPMNLPLKAFEEILKKYFLKYIPESASFETSGRYRTSRNGKLSFCLEGIGYGIPGKFIPIKDKTCLVENVDNPLPLPSTPYWVPTPEESALLLEKLRLEETNMKELKNTTPNQTPAPSSSQAQNPIAPSNHGMTMDLDQQNQTLVESERPPSPSKRKRDQIETKSPDQSTTKGRKAQATVSEDDLGSGSESESPKENSKPKQPKGKQREQDAPNWNNKQPSQNPNKQPQPKQPNQGRSKTTNQSNSSNREGKSFFNPVLKTKVPQGHKYSELDAISTQKTILTFFTNDQ